MVNLDPTLNSLLANIKLPTEQTESTGAGKPDFANAIKAVGKYVSQVDDLHLSIRPGIREHGLKECRGGQIPGFGITLGRGFPDHEDAEDALRFGIDELVLIVVTRP